VMDRARSRQIVIEHRPNQTPNEETRMQQDDTGDVERDPLEADPEQFDWEQVVTF